MEQRPSGSVTFLFTDVEGSTPLWVADEAAMAASLRVHDATVRDVVSRHDGYVFSTAGDSFAVAFGEAAHGVRCAVEIQARLAETAWPGPGLRVRIGLHRGRAEERDGDYFGTVVSTAARIASAAHGGQVICSEAVGSASRHGDLIDLGTHRLRGVAEGVPLVQVGAGTFPALRVVPPGLIRLPAPANPLVGQDDVVRSIRSAFLDRRLVTLTGVGGSGKTRLALEVGEHEIPHFADGVVFVDLAAVTDGSDVPAAVMEAADVRVGADETPSDAVVRWVSDHEVLLILDNCEHVIDDAAAMVESVLAVRTLTKVLATSREMLDVDGEQVVQVPSLGVEPRGPAVRLFVDRSAAAGAEIDAADAMVADVCARLDGMPLALELAAARTPTLTLDEMSERLDDRFSLLARARRRGRSRSRQRTLAATIDWSYALLTDEERSMFRACSVFDDSFDPDDAFGAAGVDPIVGRDLIVGLAAKSLVTTSHTATGVRYRLLETLRAYGEQKLIDHDETRTVRRRLVDHVAYRYVPPDDRILTEHSWGIIEANHRTVKTAVDLAEAFDLPIATRVRLLTASLLRHSSFTEAGFLRGERVDLPEKADPSSPATLYATFIIAVRGRMQRNDLDGALEYFDVVAEGPHPWPWFGLASRIRIRHRHDVDETLRSMPAPSAPDEHDLPDRVRLMFHNQAVMVLGGLDRELALAHLDRLDSNPLLTPPDRDRFARFRYVVEGAWAGPGRLENAAPPMPWTGELWQIDVLTPYRDAGRATTEVILEADRNVRRDPANRPHATQALVLLAVAAEAREEFDLMHRALMAVRRLTTGVFSAEVVLPVIARRHGLLDELVSRDLDDSEVRNLGTVFLELAPLVDEHVLTHR